MVTIKIISLKEKDSREQLLSRLNSNFTIYMHFTYAHIRAILCIISHLKYNLIYFKKILQITFIYHVNSI